MSSETKNWLDNFFVYEEVVPFKNLTEAAAGIQFLREDDVEVPADLTARELFDYVNALCKKREESESPLKTYKIRCTETLVADFYVEAHNADEADAIFQSWEEDDGIFDIRDRLVDSSEGWETEFAVEAVPLMAGFDIPYENGKNYLPKK